MVKLTDDAIDDQIVTTGRQANHQHTAANDPEHSESTKDVKRN
jgi:hypothetical protein